MPSDETMEGVKAGQMPQRHSGAGPMREAGGPSLVAPREADMSSLAQSEDLKRIDKTCF